VHVRHRPVRRLAPPGLGHGPGADRGGLRADRSGAARHPAAVRPAGMTMIRLGTDKLTAMYGKFTAVKSASLEFAANQVHALIGPSGCGKSTFLRALNRMHELSDHGWITGRVLLDGDDIYGPRVNAMQLRRRIGMVFQRPTPFPTM